MQNAIGPDDLDQLTVAARLGKSLRWLQALLAEDARKVPGGRRYDFHHFIGRSRRWDEAEYQALRAAIIAAGNAARPRSPHSSVTAAGTFGGLSGLEDQAGAHARVQAFRVRLRTGKPRIR